MKHKHLGLRDIAPAAILEINRLRPVSANGVAAIVASITESGVMKDRIAVRQMRDGTLQLIDGGHRKHAAIALEWPTVPCDVYECDDEWARLMEVDGNLAGAELSALDTAVFLAERAAIYERLHPETKRGMAGGLARQGLATELGSFAEITAEKFGISARQVRKIVAAGRALDGYSADLLRSAPQPVTLKDLTDIAKISDDHERSYVVTKMNLGEAKRASAARATWANQSGTAKAPVLDPVEQQVNALRQAWARAGAAARRRFVEDAGADLVALMQSGEEDAA